MWRKLGLLAITLVLVPTTAQAHSNGPGIPYHVHDSTNNNPSPNIGVPRTGPPLPVIHIRYVPPEDPPGWEITTTYSPRWTPPRIADGWHTCVRLSDGRYSSGYYLTMYEPTVSNPVPSPLGNTYRQGVYTCQYKPASTVAITDVTCATVATLTVTGTVNYSKTVTSPWTTDPTDPVKCAESLNVDAPWALSEMGRYIRTGSSTLVPCKRFDYTGTQPTEIGECGPAYSSTWTKEAQVWCDGWSEDYSGSHTYTMDECRRPEKLRWHCVGSTVKLDNHPSAAGKFSVLDDGKVRTARWSNFAVSGWVRADKNWQTQVVVKPGSSPSRPGEQDSDTQPYKVTGDSWVAGKNLPTTLQWYRPSAQPVSGSVPWVLQRTVGFDALFKRVKVRLKWVDPRTGVLTDPTYSFFEVPDHATCP